MKISYNKTMILVNENGKVFEGVFVGSIEYVTRCSYMGGGEYDIDTDYAAMFKLLTGEVIAVEPVRINAAETQYRTWSLKGVSFRPFWGDCEDWTPAEYRADVQLDVGPCECSGEFVAIETDELPF